MEHAFGLAALWFGLALLATFLASRLRVSIALVEILVGVAAATLLNALVGPNALGNDEPWLKFLAGTGAILLTFLAGAELEPEVMRRNWKEVTIVGGVGFLAPFLGCAAIARFVLGWSVPSSWLAGIALSTTSMAVVYAVMLETGFNRTPFGKAILGACFVNDLGTVIALGLMFSPFTWKTLVFIAASVAAFVALPIVTPRLANHYANRTAAFRTRWVLFVLFGLGALAAAPLVFLALFGGKVLTKIVGLYPVIGAFRRRQDERWYYTLMMSTGLTFGTISALFGLTHGLISQDQYSHLVAVVIGSAVIPTLVANAWFLPRHLLLPTEAVPVQPERWPSPVPQAEAPDPREEG